MPLEPGTTLGPYQVTAKIGEGGMGEVYRARDTKLDRDVALKVLPQAFTDDPDRLARFEREAKVLASLNHPNIGHIYGLEEAEGQKALVLELVEGPTLAERIKQGPIPVDEALPIAKQIADALEAAHEQGIIHRDLKPANVKVKDDGTVKVLDFGLAKAFQPEASDVSASMSPTISLTAAATQMGMVIGTAAYMAPEQASGKAVDKRADVWAFGVVLYEMLTGTRPFVGDDVSKTLAHVIAIDPDWSTLPKDVPPVLGTFLRGCLEKNPKQRVHDVADVRLALEGAFETTVSTSAESTGTPQLQVWQRPVPAATVTLALVAITGLAVWTLKPAATQPVSRYAVSAAPSAPVQLSNNGNDLAISPDGSRVIYQAADGMLHVRALDQLEGVPLRGTENAFHPFVSADGAWVGFMAGIGGPMQKVSILGGPPVTISELPANLRGASWGPDDVIIFGTNSASGLLQVSGAGGEPQAITTPEQGRHLFPEILPDSAGVLFTASTGPGPDDDQIALLDLDTGAYEVIIPNGTFAQYVPTGHIVYALDGTLRAVTFDLDTRRVTGDPVPVLEGVITKGSSAASFDVSESGSLVYVSGAPGGGLSVSLVWVDREGREEPLPLPPRDYFPPRLSPDGTRLAVSVFEGSTPALWVYDVVSAAGLRLTQEGAAFSPAWTPEGERVVFAWAVDGAPPALYSVRVDGSGEIESMTTSEVVDVPTAVTPDGASALFLRAVSGRQREVWEVALDGETSPTPVLQGEFDRRNADVSPDGNWLVYQSDQSGQMEIYVQPYPGPGPTVPVSIGGGGDVTWSADGSELFYRVDDRMMAVEVRPDGTVSTPTELFTGDYISATGPVADYDVGPDGRFLMLKAGDAATDDDDQPLTQVVLVQNWFQELTARVPTP